MFSAPPPPPPLPSPLVGSGDPFDRNNPFSLDAGSGGASVLSGIAVSSGDTIELRLENSPGSTGDYAGVNFTVTYIPEPATFALIGLTLVGMVRRRR